MVQIDNVIISLDIFEKRFICDILSCKGACCIEGEGGAPILETELSQITKYYPIYKKYITAEGIESITKNSHYYVDSDGDYATTLNPSNGACSYSFLENSSYRCGIEKAFLSGEIPFRKPISCSLYPIRVTYTKEGEMLNYHKWDICSCGLTLGEKESIRLFEFLKAPLINKYGEPFYQAMETLCKELILEKYIK